MIPNKMITGHDDADNPGDDPADDEDDNDGNNFEDGNSGIIFWRKREIRKRELLESVLSALWTEREGGREGWGEIKSVHHRQPTDNTTYKKLNHQESSENEYMNIE